MNYRPWCAG